MQNCGYEVLRVKVKISEDGLGDITGMVTSKDKVPALNKIFRSNLYILEVDGVSAQDNLRKLVFKCVKTNSEFTPPLCSLVADENDQQSMSIYGSLFQYFKELMLSSTLTFPNKARPFKFVAWCTR